MFIAIFIVVCILVTLVKVRMWARTDCCHCGHDNGISGFQGAAICPACGRNKTVISDRKSRKR